MKQLLIILLMLLLTATFIGVMFFSSNNFVIGNTINFSTLNGEFKFTCIPSKGRDYNMMIKEFNDYKTKNNFDSKVKIYRTTRINYFNISRWCEYKFQPEWQHEYLGPFK